MVEMVPVINLKKKSKSGIGMLDIPGSVVRLRAMEARRKGKIERVDWLRTFLDSFTKGQSKRIPIANKMDTKEFRQRGREMIDYIAEYMESVGERRVTPDVEPGYLRDLIPSKAPYEGEGWPEIMADVETKIMPGVR